MKLSTMLSITAFAAMFTVLNFDVQADKIAANKLIATSVISVKSDKYMRLLRVADLVDKARLIAEKGDNVYLSIAVVSTENYKLIRKGSFDVTNTFDYEKVMQFISINSSDTNTVSIIKLTRNKLN